MEKIVVATNVRSVKACIAVEIITAQIAGAKCKWRMCLMRMIDADALKKDINKAHEEQGF